MCPFLCEVGKPMQSTRDWMAFFVMFNIIRQIECIMRVGWEGQRAPPLASMVGVLIGVNSTQLALVFTY